MKKTKRTYLMTNDNIDRIDHIQKMMTEKYNFNVSRSDVVNYAINQLYIELSQKNRN